MPEKVKVKGNTEEEKVVQQVAQVFGQFLNYEVSIKRGEKGYEDRYLLDLKDPADQKEYLLAYLFPKTDKTTGDPYYEMLLFFNVFLPAYMNRGLIPISRYYQKPGFFAALGLMDEIKGKIKSPLEKENLKIIRSEVGEISFVFDLKKQPPA